MNWGWGKLFNMDNYFAPSGNWDPSHRDTSNVAGYNYNKEIVYKFRNILM